MLKFMKVFGLLLVCTLVFALFTSACSKAVSTKEPTLKDVTGNVYTLTDKSDFTNGVFDNVETADDNGGEIKLLKVNNAYSRTGVFTSDIIKTEPFSNLIASWNSDTPAGTSVTVEVQVLVDDQWSDWISWGTWSTNKERSSVKDDDNTKLAGISTDTLYVKDDKKATAFKIRTTLNSTESKATPILRSVSATIDLGSGAKRVYPADENTTEIENVDRKLDVPAFSQFIRDPAISSDICSPTSSTCVVDYYLNKYKHESVLPEESAYAIYDSVYEGFGNWAFGASYIGSFGLDSRVEYCASLYDLKREIYTGNPVVISIINARDENNTNADVADFPVIHGFSVPATYGHLITVTGFTKIDGKEYVCVNDSAAASDAEAKRTYLADEFDAAWATSGRVAYITNDVNGTVHNPLTRQSAVLSKTGNIDNSGSTEYTEIQLKYKGDIIDLSGSNVKTIMVSVDNGSYQYTAPTAKTNLWFSSNKPNGKYSFLIIAKDDKEYTAKITWQGGKKNSK